MARSPVGIRLPLGLIPGARTVDSCPSPSWPDPIGPPGAAQPVRIGATLTVRRDVRRTAVLRPVARSSRAMTRRGRATSQSFGPLVFIPTVRTIDPSRRALRVVARPRASHRGQYTVARVATIVSGKCLLSDRRAAPDGPVEPCHDEGERPCRESNVRTLGIRGVRVDRKREAASRSGAHALRCPRTDRLAHLGRHGLVT